MIALLLAIAAAAAPSGGSIEVLVTGVESARGTVHVDICAQPVFLTSDCRWWAVAPAVAGTTMVTIAGVPPGHYAAQGFHDANGNGKIDRTFLGIPKERFGFSRDAPVRFGPRKFSDAAFDHGEGDQHIAFGLRSFP